VQTESDLLVECDVAQESLHHRAVAGSERELFWETQPWAFSSVIHTGQTDSRSGRLPINSPESTKTASERGGRGPRATV
jgi:hypothetical protein